MQQPAQPSSSKKKKKKKNQIKKNLPRGTSIFSAEVYAINLALDLITKNRDCKHVFSNSQSAMVVIMKNN